MKNISKIKLNLVKEKLYIENLVNRLYEDIANYGEGESGAKVLMETILKEEKNKSIIEDIVDDFKLAPKFIFTFGTGIGAFYGPIQRLLEDPLSEELLKGKYKAGSTIIISLNKEEDTLEFESVEAPDEPSVDFVDSES